MTILYIDDDEDDQLIFKEAVEAIDSSWILLQAMDGKSGLALLHNRSPLIVFLDVNMPGITGKEVLKSIRATPRFNAVRIVMFSTAISESDEEEYLTCGADFCLTKPESVTTLSINLRNLLTDLYMQ